MRLRNTNPTAVRSVPFTLIELLTVMLIVGILLAVTVPIIVKLSSGSSVDAGARMIGAQLRLARQEAITKRQPVAVLFPTVDSGADKVAYVGFRACFVTNDSGTWRFDKWVQNLPWTYVPANAYIAEADDDYLSGTPPKPDLVEGGANGTITTVSPLATPPTPDPFVFTNPVRAVVFRAAGRLTSTQRGVTLVEGAIAPGTTTPVTKNAGNWVTLEVNQFTGRVSFSTPENP
jgi:prepilin-type N-terminal cleavage/methylation domain-containing protein